MGATERIVRHLKVRADSEAHVRHAVLTLEDAMRCASLPDVGARVLLVRRLNLGLISPDASSQILSRLLEQRVAAAEAIWVHALHANANRADFVFFHDALEARQALALRLAHAEPCTAWYWPLAVPEFRLAAGTPATLRSIALAVAALPEAPAAVPAWIARMVSAGVASVIAQAIGPADAVALLHAARLAVNTPRQTRSIRTTKLNNSPLISSASNGNRDDESRPPLTHAFAALPAWVQTLALAGGFIPKADDRFKPGTGVANVASVEGENKTHIAQPRPWHAEAETAPKLPGRKYQPENMHTSSAREQSKAADALNPEHPSNITPAVLPQLPASSTPFLNAVPSAYGGLLFFLPVLQRLGYPAWAENLSETAAAQIVQHLFALLLRRLQVPIDDPAWLLASTRFEDDFGDIQATAPAAWADPVLAAPRSTVANDITARVQQAQSTSRHARLWLIVCRRWLRRHAGIGVASLVLRPAALALTATHAEVYFRLNNVDIRVRRAGLDLNPGWLPWYGRVVSFHYGLDA